MYKNQTRILGLIFGLVLLVVLVPSAAAQANPQFLGPGAQNQLGKLGDYMQWLAGLNTFMHILLLIVLNFCQYLLQADFLQNTNMMSAMNSIWVLSRNIMNILFALMLIGVALYTIVTANKRFVQEKLLNFVVAIILVNFSWFIPRVIIDVANVLTATIYTVPQMIGITCHSLDENDRDVPCQVVRDILIFPPDIAAQNTFCAQYGTTPNSNTCPCSDSIGCYAIAPYNSAGGAGVGHTMINALVINFGKILTINKVQPMLAGPAAGAGARDGFMGNLQFLMIIAIAAVVQLAVLLPLVGLVFGLLIRILVLWVTIAFMPFIFLGYIVNGKLGTNVFGFETDVWKEFINAAFLPTMVALPITIGFVMLSAAVQIPAPTGAFPQTWSIPLVYGVKSWWSLLWSMAAIVILWTGSFAALKKSEFTSKFTEKIRGFGENIFGAAVQLPLLTPIPLPGGKTGNVGGLLNKAGGMADLVRQSARTGKSFGELTGGGTLLSGQVGGRKNPLNVKDAAEDISKNDENTKKLVEAIQSLDGAKTAPARDAILANDNLKQLIRVEANASSADVLKRLEDLLKNADIRTHARVVTAGAPALDASIATSKAL